MPRKRKPEVPAGQPYGQRKRLEDAIASAPTAAPTPAQPQAPVAAAAGPSIQDLIAQAQMGPPPVQGGLFGPSTNPTQPVTAGAPVGAGPSMVPTMRRRDVTAEILDELARATGDSLIADLAGVARRRMI